MKLSNFYLFTSKENPSDAHIESHKLMIRAGMIRQASAGIYNWLPFGLLALKKIENIIRKSHFENNINELLMPTIQSADIWKKSGRYEDYGQEMLKFLDRNNSELLYGPTNEEQITDIILKDLKSYKNFPKVLYHFQWKFRDELRPRFGVMRGREFLMKDAYSFDVNYEDAYLAYAKMFVLYMNIFKSLGLKVLPFNAETGPIGGTLSHEFVVESKTGESEIFFDKRAYDIIYETELSDEKKLKAILENYGNFYCCTLEKHKKEKFEKLVEKKHQIKTRGIEVGHIFYFGTKYSEKLNAKFLDKKGNTKLIHSGSYGIGVSRLVGAIIEANHDSKGIKWPKEVAPYQVLLINVNVNNRISTEFCENFYYKNNKFINILYDDKDDRIGHKLYNADLLGIPIQVIVGERNLLNDNIEIKVRDTNKAYVINKEQLKKFIKEFYEF